MFARDVYKDSKAPGYILLAVTLRKYGLDSLDYEPELLRMQIESDYDIKLTDLQSDKLQAAITVFSTDHFEGDWRVFETCCHLFSNELVDHDVINQLEAEELIVGVAEAVLIKGDIGDVLHYDDEVRAYAGQVFYEYGFSKPPKLFPTAIMPANAVEHDDKEKNAALKELFDAHAQYILDYYEKLS